MTALTSDQLNDLRADLGDTNCAFSADDLNRLYARAGGHYNTAVWYGFRQLLISAATWNDYSVGLSSEKKSQLFDHMLKLADYWGGLVLGGNQMAIVGMRRVPSPVKDIPAGEHHPDEKALGSSSGWRYRYRTAWNW